MSAPVTHEEVGIVLSVFVGSVALLSGIVAATFSSHASDLRISAWLGGFGLAIISAVGLAVIL